MLIFLTVAVVSAQAFDLRHALADIPGMEKCTPNFQMFDASGKLPSGISAADMFDFGNFDQCLQIENTTIPLRGKYCMVAFNFPKERVASLFKTFGYNFTDSFDERIIFQGMRSLRLGWCLPHTCPIEELTKVLTAKLNTPVTGGMCQTKDDLVNKYDSRNIIIIIFLGATLFLMIISTLYDMYLQYNKKKPAHIILLAFSVRTNGQKLLSISNNADQLECLNGIRFISMMWILLLHRRVIDSASQKINGMSDNPLDRYIWNAIIAVDSFLVLSGLLVAYNYCLARDKAVKFNIILFYVHRYLRLTPVLAVVVWVHATIIDFFGSGPFWPPSTLKTNCMDYWCSALVYVQNYYNVGNRCVDVSWYLSVDMQLYVLSPMILIPLWKWPKWTLISCTISVLGSRAISFASSYVQGLNNDYHTHMRYAPWLMGLMLGYYLFKLKKNKINRIRLHPALIVFGWIVGIGLLVSALFAEHYLSGYHRHVWALGLCWLIYACTQGYGGPINTFLSWSLFQIFARFTYTMYLVHLTVQKLLMYSSRTHIYLSDFHIMYTFWGDFMLSLAIAVCLTLAYELPMVTIEKVLFKTGHKPKELELLSYNPTSS